MKDIEIMSSKGEFPVFENQRQLIFFLVDTAITHPAQFAKDTPKGGGLVDVDSA